MLITEEVFLNYGMYDQCTTTLTLSVKLTVQRLGPVFPGEDGSRDHRWSHDGRLFFGWGLCSGCWGFLHFIREDSSCLLG